ncbi:transglutaminase TgpA family protein [Flindersiella endophytica]
MPAARSVSSTIAIAGAGALAVCLSSFALLPAYEGAAWFAGGAVTVAFVVAIGLGLRQLGTPQPLIPLAQLAGLVWAFLLVGARDDLIGGLLPSGDAFEFLAQRLVGGAELIVRQSAPMPFDADLILITALAIGLTAIAVDALAATFRQVPWAGLPLLMLYTIPAVAVPGVVSALTFIPAAAGYVILLTSEGRERLTRWGRGLGDLTPVGSISPARRTGRLVGATVIGIAVVVPAVLPTLQPMSFLQQSSSNFGTGATTIQVSNPMLDLKRNLIRPYDVPVMSYTTTGPDPEYLRMVVLDDFDGESWEASNQPVRDVGNGGALPAPPGLEADKAERQHYAFQIEKNLRSKWLPAPYPSSAVRSTAEVGYTDETHDIVVRDGESAGVAYQVDGITTDFTATQLKGAAAPPDNIRERYTRLPDGIPNEVKETADRAIRDAKAESAYDRAVALQTFFRAEFTYSLDRVQGHSDSALLDFLSDRSGYCEQFAATMAIMARQQGIPARVAVGYLSGDEVGNDRRVVSAQDAHAWPELYFSGAGWVRFEPTPSARVPFEPLWTVPETEQTAVPTDEPTPTPSASATTAPTEPTPTESETAAPTDSSGGGFLPRLDFLLPVLGGLGILLVLATPGLVRSGLRRRRLARGSPPRSAEAAWDELADVHRDLGLGWDEAETPRTTSARVLSKLSDPSAQLAAELRRLVSAVERCRYAPDPANVPDVRASANVVRSAVWATASWQRRLLARALPRSLWHRLRTRLRLS